MSSKLSSSRVRPLRDLIRKRDAELSNLRTLTETQARELAELRNRHVIAAEELHAKWMQDPEYAKAWASGAGDRDIIDVYRKQLAAVTRERDELKQDRDEWRAATIDANKRFKFAEKECDDLKDTVARRDAEQRGDIERINALNTKCGELRGRLSVISAEHRDRLGMFASEVRALLVRIAELEAGK